MQGAVIWQRAEGALVFAAAIGLWALGDPGMAWWPAILVFFAPDLAGPRVGAAGYNAVHVYGFGAIVLALGLWLSVPALAACGALWLGHAGFDRMLGYGLKLPRGFTHTHLGPL